MDQFTITPDERLRILESDYNLIRDRIMIINQGLIESHKKLSHEFHLLSQELKETKSELSELKLLTNHIIQEMNQFAKKDQVKVLEKYINLWNPLHFTTEQDVLTILKQRRGVKHRTSPKAKAHR